MRGSKSPDGCISGHMACSALHSTRPRPLPSRAACMLSRTARRVWRYVRYDFPEMVLPSSLPDAPDVARKRKLMRQMTLRQHLEVRLCLASLLGQPAASRRADDAGLQIWRATWTEYRSSFRDLLPDKRAKETEEAAEGDASASDEGAALKQEAGANPWSAGPRGACPRLTDAPLVCVRRRSRRRTLLRRARSPVASRDVRDPRGRLPGRPSRVCARLPRSLPRHASAGACAGCAHAAAPPAPRLTRWRVCARFAPLRRRRACSRRLRTQERDQRGREQAAEVQHKRTRRRVARRRGRQTCSQMRRRGVSRQGHRGAAEMLAIMC